MGFYTDYFIRFQVQTYSILTSLQTLCIKHKDGRFTFLKQGGLTMTKEKNVLFRI